MQILQTERNLDRLTYLDNALKGHGDDLSLVAANLMNPTFAPTGVGTPPALKSMEGKNAEEIQSLLDEQMPPFQSLDVPTRENIANLFVDSPPQARAALFEILPALNNMPDEARFYALEQLNGMQQNDFAKVAGRLRANGPQDWNALGTEAMNRAETIFGPGRR
jgi:hypothetical protein